MRNILDIAIADIHGGVILNTLVNSERPAGGPTTIHDITDDMVMRAPTFF